MQQPPLETVQEYFYKTEQGIIDNQTASSIKKKLAQEFKDQLTIGIPTRDMTVSPMRNWISSSTTTLNIAWDGIMTMMNRKYKRTQFVYEKGLKMISL